LFDHAHAVVGIDDLVAYVEIQVSTIHKKHPGRRRVKWGKSVIFTVNRLSRNGPKSKDWCGVGSLGKV
jgi:hypothetical protein